MGNCAPIGVFDSGVGGLSVLKSIREVLPNEDLIYLADSGNAPYGDKSPQYIQQRALAISRFLLDEGAKAIVVACNTATIASVGLVRAHYTLPIIGMEPGIKPAVAQSRSGVVGVLATSGTVRSQQFIDLVNRFRGDVNVIIQECPGLVEQVEKLDFDSLVTKDLLETYLERLLAEGADTLVLGCTHYPFLVPLIKQIAGDDINIIDTGRAVARQLQRRIEEAGLLSQQTTPGTERFWTSSADGDGNAIKGIWGQSLQVGLMNP